MELKRALAVQTNRKGSDRLVVNNRNTDGYASNSTEIDG